MNLEEIPEDVLRFVLEQIDSVPHLEALLIFWSNAAQTFSVEKIAAELYISPDVAAGILQGLLRRKLIRVADPPPRYAYDGEWDTTDLMSRVASTYRTRLVRVATLIHSKSSQSVRDFARAFVFKKD